MSSAVQAGDEDRWNKDGGSHQTHRLHLWSDGFGSDRGSDDLTELSFGPRIYM